jgi:predicted amidophosphoribosyltransferase
MFVDKQSGKEDEALPGSGLEVDLDRRVCPDCGREAPPWEEQCRDCGVATVAPEDAPAATFDLPHLEDRDPDHT